MNQRSPVDVVTPSGDDRADRALYDDIRRYLGRDEVVDTIMLSGFIARDRFDPAQPVLAVRAGDELVAVAVLTPGFFLLLSHVEHAAAGECIAAEVVRQGIELPGVMGPPEPAFAFAEAWSRRAGGRFRPGMRQRILSARHVKPPPGVPGRWRLIEPADHPLLVEWFTDFAIDIDHVAPDAARARGQGMADRLDGRSGLLWLDDGGAPVSIACSKAPTPNGIRIGPVYTPPEHRRRGYAAAVTAVATRLMLDRGYAFTCLYTDAANATANHVYESIGYEFVADSTQYLLAKAPQ